jgi:hypothetical protein
MKWLSELLGSREVAKAVLLNESRSVVTYVPALTQSLVSQLRFK